MNLEENNLNENELSKIFYKNNIDNINDLSLLGLI
jgi:hypothetical protein